MEPVTVRVLVDCSCSKPWYICALQCPAGGIEVEYDCEPMGPDDPSVPSPIAIAWIERWHPGKRLAYIKPSAYFDELLIRARSEVATLPPVDPPSA